MNSTRQTAPTILAMKAAKKPIVCLTAYDFYSAQLADAAGVDLILVGDSVGTVIQGRHTTVRVTLRQMIYHTEMVSRGVKSALVVADLPFGSYQSSVSQAVDSAVALMQSGAGAVKLEGAYCDEIAAIRKAGIPVMGHVGMTPQSVHAFGGHRVQGKDSDGDRVIQDAVDIQNAGAFGIVLELIPAALSAKITAQLAIPTIGIGAGAACDGQIQVWHDILGLTDLHLKHAKRYLEAGEMISEAVQSYAQEVRTNAFPGDARSS